MKFITRQAVEDLSLAAFVRCPCRYGTWYMPAEIKKTKNRGGTVWKETNFTDLLSRQRSLMEI